MGDIDPFSQIQQYTPRSVNLVDAVAETKRVVESALRANPLRNARVDDGLMRWKGNYSGGVDRSYLWIGEFLPRDAVLNKPQRGFILSRDDSKAAPALHMYDPNGESANALTQPLRQLVFMRDADNNPMLTEGRGGGVTFPWSNVVLYPQITDYYQITTPSGNKFLPVIGANAATNGGPRALFDGFGPMVGSRLKFFGFVAASTSSPVGPSVGVHLEVSFNDGSPTVVTSTITSPAGGSANLFWDLDFAGQNKVGTEVRVRVLSGIVSGSPEWSFVQPLTCISYAA